jgi:hypothetical protein
MFVEHTGYRLTVVDIVLLFGIGRLKVENTKEILE